MSAPFVFSIRPEYVARIFDGSKRYEYRTRRPSMRPGDLFLIYETAPVSMIVAEAWIHQVICEDPRNVWDHTAHAAGIDRAAFDAYFLGRDYACALDISKTRWLPDPAPLPSGMAPPQSWARYKGSWAR